MQQIFRFGGGSRIPALVRTQFTVILTGWMRCARLFVMVELANAQAVNAMHHRGSQS